MEEKTHYSRAARVIKGGARITAADVERFLKDSGPWAEIVNIEITRPAMAELLSVDVRYIQVTGHKFNGTGK